ncbi:MAG: tetraacyldisaccharide 4'-kinase [Rickettsiales bacterium]|jgi:tetraacyldisaccharide 4'-kinase|nr:tetraacyldisaccharide 4'-kinase [Rickettsiales bacterium]
MRTPRFWRTKNITSILLYPLGVAYYLCYKIRCCINFRPYKSRIPVICIGNLIAGGSGKTPTAIEIAKELRAKKVRYCFLSKGYGGKFNGILQVSGQDTAEKVGDEAMIMCEYGDTFISKDRVNGLKYINENFDYDHIIMDDGLQNPTFIKDKIILVVDGVFGFGNGFILPAGALREKFSNVRNRVDTVVINGEDRHNISLLCNKYNITCINSRIRAEVGDNLLKNEYVAFCGLGMPEKFEKTLVENNIKVVKFIPFGDHYNYTERDIESLKKYGHKLLTTKKDWVRLTDRYRKEIEYLDIYLDFGDKKIL